MNNNPTVFTSASQISIALDPHLKYKITLSAPGFLCELTHSFSGMGLLLRVATEQSIRPGLDGPLSFVENRYTQMPTPIVHFTTRVEAERLIAAIQARLKAAGSDCHGEDEGTGLLRRVSRVAVGGLTHVARLLTTGVQYGTIALILGFVGAGAARLGWDVASPVLERFTGISTEDSYTTFQRQIDRADYSKEAMDRMLESLGPRVQGPPDGDDDQDVSPIDQAHYSQLETSVGGSTGSANAQMRAFIAAEQRAQ